MPIVKSDKTCTHYIILESDRKVKQSLFIDNNVYAFKILSVYDKWHYMYARPVWKFYPGF
jgi:hypothetical protein